MTDLEKQGETPRTEAPHVPAAFINAIAEEGTKQEAVEWLQKEWNENRRLTRELAQMAAQKAKAERDRDDALSGCQFEFQRAMNAESRVSELEAKLAEEQRDAERWQTVLQFGITREGTTFLTSAKEVDAIAAERKEGKHG